MWFIFHWLYCSFISGRFGRGRNVHTEQYTRITKKLFKLKEGGEDASFVMLTALNIPSHFFQKDGVLSNKVTTRSNNAGNEISGRGMLNEDESSVSFVARRRKRKIVHPNPTDNVNKKANMTKSPEKEFKTPNNKQMAKCFHEKVVRKIVTTTKRWSGKTATREKN